MLLSSLVQFAILSGLVAAYPAQNTRNVGSRVQARDCSAHINAFNLARRAKRSQNKRSIYSGIQNNTCVTSPEVSGTDNWTSNAPVRTDLTEGQVGVPLVMDVGVMDMSTCGEQLISAYNHGNNSGTEAMPNALVEIWSANAVGEYGATFLRGGTPTDSTGIAELNTIFPGFTPGAASHIGIKVHPNWKGGSTITSNAAAHIGRLFFTDQWSVVIGMSAPYNTNSVKQTTNEADSAFSQANSQGYNAVVDLEEIFDDWPSGVVGYITVGVNAKNSFTN